MSNDTPLGTITNELEGSRVATQGLGAPYVKEVPMFFGGFFIAKISST
jgi:hypothetical protein